MDIKDLIEEAGYSPRRKAACHGGEYSSPCPFCKDGDDRLIIWPNRHNKNGEYQGGRYSCRKCEKYGDAITFLRDLHGLDYRDACTHLKITPKTRQFAITPKELPRSLVALNPAPMWIEKATAFTEWCHSKLLSTSSALEKVLARGFTIDSIKHFKIGFNPGDIRGYDFRINRQDWGLDDQLKEDGTSRKLWLPVGFTIPTFSADRFAVKVKVRRSSWQEGDKLPKYVEVSGSKSAPSIYGDSSLPIGLVLESEFDALLIQQEAAELLYCVALGGSTKPIDACTDDLLKKAKNILFLPDYDAAGALAWVKWKRLFPGIHRILTPKGKAAGDAFIEGVNLREWIEAGITNSNKT